MRLIGFKSLTATSLLILLSSCSRGAHDIEPKIKSTISSEYIQSLPSAFSPLSSQEKNTDWGKEYLVGNAFAENLDFYRAITSYRRAEVLIFDDNPSRKLEIQYDILLCYYMGRRYEEVITAFEKSGLKQVTTEFPPFQDLLLILFDSYDHLDEPRKAGHILNLLKEYYPKTYDTMVLSTAMRKGNLEEIKEIQSDVSLEEFFRCYDREKKSPTTASVLNAVLPGAGYLFVGQRQTAATAFLINGLFIWGSVHSFLKGNIAAGTILASFEAGWYIGGIHGASIQAKLYNERLYETCATPLMHKERLFPILRLSYAF